MLEAFIIEEIRRREEAQSRSYEAPRLELPLDERDEPASPRSRSESRSETSSTSDEHRGVFVIEY